MSNPDYGRQAPTTGDLAKTYSEMWRIITHPAFRLGFMDAQTGRGLDHDRIGDRILAETPDASLERLGFNAGHLFDAASIEFAQYRYEEGRLCVLQLGLKARAWAHPEFPPKQMRDFIKQRASENSKSGDAHDDRQGHEDRKGIARVRRRN